MDAENDIGVDKKITYRGKTYTITSLDLEYHERQFVCNLLRISLNSSEDVNEEPTLPGITETERHGTIN